MTLSIGLRPERGFILFAFPLLCLRRLVFPKGTHFGGTRNLHYLLAQMGIWQRTWVSWIFESISHSNIESKGKKNNAQVSVLKRQRALEPRLQRSRLPSVYYAFFFPFIFDIFVYTAMDVHRCVLRVQCGHMAVE